MNRHVDISCAQEKIETVGGCLVLLFDRLAKSSVYGQLECARNVFLVDSSGRVEWQVRSDYDAEGAPFTHIFFSGDRLRAYRWDGGLYEIDLKDGRASPIALLR